MPIKSLQGTKTHRFLYLIFISHNEVVINPRYTYGSEVHSIFRFLLDFYQSADQYVKGSQSSALRDTIYLSSVWFSGKVSYSWIIYTVIVLDLEKNITL